MEENAKILCKMFKSETPFLIGRNGTIELEVVLFYLKYRINGIKYPVHLLQKLEQNAGIFPATEESVDIWVDDYVEALKMCDCFAEGWYKPLEKEEYEILEHLIPSRIPILLRNLEPYYVEPNIRWSQYLAGKKVAIINSFAETCEEQTYLSKAIWGSDNSDSLLPSTTCWIPIQTFYSPLLAGGNAGWPPYILNWKDAIIYIVNTTIISNPDIAIIGCGGMGLIIGALLKKEGIKVILMGGATQILFGIKGKRWLNHEVISGFINDAWVYPSRNNIPNGYKQIEGGCYW